MNSQGGNVLKKIVLYLLVIALSAAVLPFNTLAAHDAPFTLTVTSTDGADVIIGPKNDSGKLSFRLAPTNGVFGESFTLDKIVNKSSNEQIELNSSVSSSWTSCYIGSYTMHFNELDAGMTVEFELYWTDSKGVQKTETAEFKLSKPEPKAEVKTDLDGLIAVPGATVTVNYEVTNVGNVPIDHIYVSDDIICGLIGKSYIYATERSSDVLKVGESIVQSVSFVIDGTITSAPVVVYAYNNKTYEAKGDVCEISVNEVVPEISLYCDNYSLSEKNAEQTFFYTIHNTSAVTLTNVRVYDSDGSNAHLVCDPFELPAGEIYENSYTLNITKSGFYKFKVVYSYEGADGDKEISAKTDKSIRLPNEVYLKISEISPESISEAGDVIFTLTIENGTTSELKDINITEASNLADPLNVNVIIPAATQTKKAEYSCDMTTRIPSSGTKVKFVLSYKIDNELYTTYTSYDVRFDSPLVTPTPFEEQQEPEGNTNGLLLWILIGVLLLLLIAALIVILVILKKKSSFIESEPVVKRRVSSGFDDDYGYDGDDIPDDGMDDMTDEIIPEESIDDIDDDGVRIYKKK